MLSRARIEGRPRPPRVVNQYTFNYWRDTLSAGVESVTSWGVSVS